MIHPVATLPLSSKHRISQIVFHPSRAYLAVQSHDKSVEIFRIRTEEEVRKKQARRKKRAKEKEQTKSKGEGPNNNGVDEDEDAEQQVSIPDLFTPYLVVRTSGKIRSFDFAEESSSAAAKGITQIFLALANNSLEVYNIPQPTKSKEEVPEATRILSLDIPGHRADVRTLCLSSDDVLLASAANGNYFSFIIAVYSTHTERKLRFIKDLEYEDNVVYSYNGVWVRHLQYIPSRRPADRGGDQERRDSHI